MAEVLSKTLFYADDYIIFAQEGCVGRIVKRHPRNLSAFTQYNIYNLK